MIETKMPPTAERIRSSFEHLGTILAFLIGSNEPYKVSGEASELERKKIKDDFIAGKLDEPTVSYPLLDDEVLHHGEYQIFHVLEQINQLPEDAETNLAHEVIARKLAELYRHREVARSLRSKPEEKTQSLERAKQLTLEVFGEPDQTTFEGMLLSQRTIAESQLDAADEAVQKVAREFLQLTGKPENAEPYKRPELSDAAMKNLRQDFAKLFPQIFELAAELPTDRKLTHEESLVYFQNCLDALAMKGWRAVLTEGNVVEVSARRREVQIGRNRAPFTAATILPKAIHEVVWHALRSHNGAKLAESTDKKVAAVSLPENLVFEEGVATASEQPITGKRRSVGEQYYWSCSLQLGLDQQGSERNFRQTYEIMWRRAVLNQAKEGKATSIEKAQNAAYQAVMRTRRGGVIDTRDLSYFNGFQKAVAWLNNLAELPKSERRAALTAAFRAKFDPTAPDQTEYIAA